MGTQFVVGTHLAMGHPSCCRAPTLWRGIHRAVGHQLCCGTSNLLWGTHLAMGHRSCDGAPILRPDAQLMSDHGATPLQQSNNNRTASRLYVSVTTQKRQIFSQLLPQTAQIVSPSECYCTERQIPLQPPPNNPNRRTAWASSYPFLPTYHPKTTNFTAPERYKQQHKERYGQQYRQRHGQQYRQRYWQQESDGDRIHERHENRDPP